jgi:hypothetical protein
MNGEWRLAPDPRNEGREQGYARAVPSEAQSAPVPGIIQQVFPRSHGVFWYYHRFTGPPPPGRQERALLRFGMVDYLAEVWLNGQFVGGHEGGETPFDLDVTAALQPEGENLLAVRVLNPDNSGIDGIRLDETPHRNKRCADVYRPGDGYNTGGILLPVVLETVPAVWITDVFARAEGDVVRLTVTVQNSTGQAAAGDLATAIAPGAGGRSLAAEELTLTAPPGTSTHELALAVADPRRWDLDDPYLYRASVALTARLGSDSLRHDYSVRFGFRELRVGDGFFVLNGRRLFLRSTHTGNHCPIGQVVPPEPGFLRKDLLMAKAAGYNTVRFISGVAYPEQLDLCDEIGLMVYEECYAGWLLGESPEMKRRFDFSVREMVQRDRNHPSVTIWGLLNETTDNSVFRHAVESLAALRALDPTRLVLLSSGRWDQDLSIGSVSNPGSPEWEPVWGGEGPGEPTGDWDLVLTSPADRRGDLHMYPRLPQSPEDDRIVREIGAGEKPVFLSEYGIGSQFNAVDELRDFDRFAAREDLIDRSMIRSWVERLQGDFARWGLEGVFAFPEDFFRASYRHMVAQRRRAFDLIRSNPQICGYNLTGMLDHALTGEGIWSLWRTWKPGALDMMQDGWAPLRWCLFVSPVHAHAGRPVQIEAVLANEDVLAAGEYPVLFRVFGSRSGVVWERETVVRIVAGAGEQAGPLAVPVLSETLLEGLAADEYVLAAHLVRGATPRGDRLAFRVSEPVPARDDECSVQHVGLDPATLAWLAARGVAGTTFAPAAGGPPVVLVGAVPCGETPAATWEALREHADAGGTVVFLSAAPFLAGPAEGAPPPVLPLGDAVQARTFWDWLYHKEIVAQPHALFGGLPTGLLDWSYYGQVWTHEVFDCRETPAEVAAASLAVGYACPSGYDSGVVMAVYHYGQGRVIVNSMRVLEELDRHPAADQLLLNLISVAGQG